MSLLDFAQHQYVLTKPLIFDVLQDFCRLAFHKAKDGVLSPKQELSWSTYFESRKKSFDENLSFFFWHNFQDIEIIINDV